MLDRIRACGMEWNGPSHAASDCNAALTPPSAAKVPAPPGLATYRRANRLVVKSKKAPLLAACPSRGAFFVSVVLAQYLLILGR